MPELSALRLVKVPDAAPPFDCEVHGARCAARAGGLAVAVTADAPGVSVAHTDAPGVSVADTDAPGGPVADTVAPGGPVADTIAAGTAALALAPAAADPTTAQPRHLALVVVEVLAGVRPQRQLVPLATDRVRARIAGLAPLLACDRRPRVARIVTSRPAARVVEMTVVVSFGPRSRALAMRFEHVAARPAAPGWPARPARWLCTAIEAG
jgi:hypothetical protein